ncbi:unnamed protein product [Schistosoma turkestanicum]|nr:unnamed protein product [Schistosoma turkestanicum]
MANPLDSTRNNDAEDLINTGELNQDEQNVVESLEKNVSFAITSEHALDDSIENSIENVARSLSERDIDNKSNLVESQNLTHSGSNNNSELDYKQLHPNITENNDTNSQNVTELYADEKTHSQNSTEGFIFSSDAGMTLNSDTKEFDNYCNQDPSSSKFFEHTFENKQEPTASIIDLSDPTVTHRVEQYPIKSEADSSNIDDQVSVSTTNSTNLELSGIGKSNDIVDTHSSLEGTSFSGTQNDEINNNKHETLSRESSDGLNEGQITNQFHEEVHMSEETENDIKVSEYFSPQEEISQTKSIAHSSNNDKNDISFDLTVHDVNSEVGEYYSKSNTGASEEIIQTLHEEFETKTESDLSTSSEQSKNEDNKHSHSLEEQTENAAYNVPEKSQNKVDIYHPNYPTDVEFPVAEQRTTEYESHHEKNDNNDFENKLYPNSNFMTVEQDFRTSFIRDVITDNKNKLLTESPDTVDNLQSCHSQDNLQWSISTDSSHLQCTNSSLLNYENLTEIDETKSETSPSDKDMLRENDLENGSLLYATENLTNELQIVEHLTDDRPEPLNITADIQGNELYNAKIHKKEAMECHLTEDHSDDYDRPSMSNYEVDNILPKHSEETLASRNGSNKRNSIPEELTNHLNSKPFNDASKDTELHRIHNDIDEISLNSEGEQKTEFEKRYAELIAKYLPVERQTKKNDRSRRTKTLDRYSKSKFNENRYSYIDTSDVKKRAVTLERNEFRRKRRLQPKPSINDDYLYPDSVTPSKVDKSISVRSLEEGIPEGAYDVPYIDDDAFLPRRLRENRGEENGSDEDSSLSLAENYWSWNPDRFSRLEANHIADTNECAATPENQPKSKTLTSILSKKKKHHQKQDLIAEPRTNINQSKNRGKSLLCGCVSRKSKNR